ncbi:MAG: aminopeptidase P family protein [Ruminococcus sp.]|nr:aminopeptidase P family protein [Ruminococcus sp.]
MSVQKRRINNLRKIIDDNSVALLITGENNIYYFSGFQKSEGAMLVTRDESYLLVDFRYVEAATKTACDCKVIEFKSLVDEVKALLQKHDIKTLILESDVVTVSKYNKYVRAFNEVGVSIVSDDTLSKAISNLRIIKSEEEIAFISEAQRITEMSYNEVLNFIKPGISEKTVANELEYLMKKNGAEGISFDLITITGKKTSLPHGVPSDDVINEGDFFTMDIGALYNGYHSDMTRTVAVKSCSNEQREIYDIVLKAQISALNAVKSGVKACDVDKIARDIITDAGYGENFGHSTGHGVGLDIHEAPFVSPKGETILSDNMIITIEPGIYLENKFGVRIEDMVMVQNNGFRNFATLDKELIIV